MGFYKLDNKRLRSTIGYFLVFVLCFFIFSGVVLVSGIKLMQKYSECYSFLGKHVIIENDTCNITHWKMIEKTYILSNGKEVDEQLITNKTLKTY